MARTTSELVIGLLLQDYDSANLPSLTPFIDTANLLVTRVNVCAASRGYTLTSGELELIERWLAAHFYCQSDRTYTERKTLSASGKFAGRTEMYLESTLYGQTATRLDASGCLSSIAAADSVEAQVLWVGKPPSSQVPYLDRD